MYESRLLFVFCFIFVKLVIDIPKVLLYNSEVKSDFFA